MQKSLAPLTQAVTEILEGYLSYRGFPLRNVGSKPQARHPSPEHQSWEEVLT